MYLFFHYDLVYFILSKNRKKSRAIASATAPFAQRIRTPSLGRQRRPLVVESEPRRAHFAQEPGRAANRVIVDLLDDGILAP